MITDEQHLKMARILGIPECCAREWVTDRFAAGDRRGAVYERTRTPEEIAYIDDQISKLLGRLWSTADDPRKLYVPCSAHMGCVGWTP